MVRTILLLMLLGGSTVSWASQDPTAPLNWQKPRVTLPKANKVVKHSLPRVQSIICSDSDECKAVVSGRIVMVGDCISGFQVKNIESESVTLSRGGKRWNLELFALDIKQ